MTRSTSTLLALFLMTASPAFAQTNITGDWDVTVTSPQGPNTTLVSFKQDGEKISGIFKSPQGELPFQGGTLTGSDLKFVFTINTQGMELPITLTGKVDGATMRWWSPSASRSSRLQRSRRSRPCRPSSRRPPCR